LAQDVSVNKETTKPVEEHSKTSQCGSLDSPEFACQAHANNQADSLSKDGSNFVSGSACSPPVLAV